MQVSYTHLSENATPFFTKKSHKEKGPCYNKANDGHFA